MKQICDDCDGNYAEVNRQLDKMGYNIGQRLIEDYFAKSGAAACTNFRDTAEAISRVCAVAPAARGVLTFYCLDRLQDVP